jgi:hypothetical protein
MRGLWILVLVLFAGLAQAQDVNRQVVADTLRPASPTQRSVRFDISLGALNGNHYADQVAELFDLDGWHRSGKHHWGRIGVGLEGDITPSFTVRANYLIHNITTNLPPHESTGIFDMQWSDDWTDHIETWTIGAQYNLFTLPHYGTITMVSLDADIGNFVSSTNLRAFDFSPNGPVLGGGVRIQHRPGDVHFSFGLEFGYLSLPVKYTYVTQAEQTITGHEDFGGFYGQLHVDFDLARY